MQGYISHGCGGGHKLLSEFKIFGTEKFGQVRNKYLEKNKTRLLLFFDISLPFSSVFLKNLVYSNDNSGSLFYNSSIIKLIVMSNQNGSIRQKSGASSYCNVYLDNPPGACPVDSCLFYKNYILRIWKIYAEISIEFPNIL